GLDEFGFSKHGIAGNDVYEIWRYNRQFFDHVLVSPKFKDYTVKSINKLFEELRWYWQSLGMQKVPNNKNNNNWTLETDFSEWFHAYANEAISVIVTSERTYSIASYYNMQRAVKHEYSDAMVEDGNKFVKALVDHIHGLTFFMLVGKFLRHYVPIIKDMANFYLKN
ncbi:19496_t:CDS:1, partial [Cetraspora pellucida]